MRRISLQRRQSVANNAIQNCAFLVGKKRIGRDEKKREKIRSVIYNRRVDWKGRGDASGKGHWKGVNGGWAASMVVRVAFFDYWSFETFRRDAIRKSRAGKSQRNKRLSFINVPSECIIQARWIYNHSHFEWERNAREKVYLTVSDEFLFHPSDPAPLRIRIRARIRYSSREKAGRSGGQ